MHIRRLTRILAIMAVILAGVFGSAGPSSARTLLGQASGSAPEVCVIVVDKAPPGQWSPVRSRACAADYATAQRDAGATATVLLMEWFWNANNQPPKLTRIQGSAGECDSSGYHINIYDDWANNISGFNAYSSCNVAVGYDLPLGNGDLEIWQMHAVCECLLQGWVGARMNDRIESFWIRHG